MGQVLHGALHYLDFRMVKLKQSCSICPRINENFKVLRQKFKEHHNKPVYGVGSIKSNLCIVGLAPGLHGANKTGIPFTDDFSGLILNKCLNISGFNKSSINNYPYITNTVKCFPPNNKPSLIEINNCSVYLQSEFNDLSQLKLIIALGKVAHNSVIKFFDKKNLKYPFIHGAFHIMSNKITLLDSYHCSKININNKRLTETMLINILKSAKSYIEINE